MKSPAQYLDHALTPWPDPTPSGGVPHVKVSDAEAAVAAALADAHRYYGLLLRAIRNSNPSLETPAGPQTNGN